MKTKIFLLLFCSLASLSGFAQSGTCGADGDNLAWNFNSATGTLTIDGTGKMADYEYNTTPWHNLYSQITQVVIGTDVTSIGASAFYKCALTSVDIPNGVASIGKYAFNSCAGLASVTIPNSVTSIGVYAFYGTPWYDGLPDGCVYINRVLYAYKGSMPPDTAIEVKEATVSITGNAFLRCAGLTSVVIPNSVTEIGSHTFFECTGLTSIDIPESVASIGDYAFSRCTGLSSINVAGNNPNYTSRNGVLFNKQETTLVYFPCAKSESYYAIPEGVTDIRDGAFLVCTGLVSIGIPNGITRIGADTFSGCAGLVSVDMSNNVTDIGSWAFAECIKLSSIDMPDNLTSIGENAFYRCAFTSVTIPENVVSIGENAFQRSALTTVNYNAVNCTKMGGFDTWTFDGPVFSECELSVISIGNEVRTISDYAFYRAGITSIDIPGSVTDIGAHAFSGCRNLTSVDIPGGVMNIGDYAFSGCSGLLSIDIPGSVASIGEFAFSACGNLTAINVDTGNLDYVSEDGVLFDSDMTVLICFPGGKTGSYTVPDGVEDIAELAFYYCTGLTSVTIPNSVTNIGSQAFYNCTGLTSINCRASEPPAAKSNTFRGVKVSDCKLYVPVGSKSDYEEADGWKNFNIEEKDFISIEPDISVAEIQIYLHNNGIAIAGITRGESITVYNAAGVLAASVVADGSEMSVALPGRGVYVVKAMGKAVKVVL